ncbi:unnamed protein product [Clonostachys rosea f. rosea IK726]|uniref:Bul1 C-terminal domain-containing protein n=2 Tax=Bionectria ochroleuca TaxID=29856 RepID=A0A8H7NPD2_BIOOC|nr:unnamed protein product [Clonostachys rosea f. rosea IK726]
MAMIALGGTWAKWSAPLLGIKCKLPLKVDIQIENHFEAKIYATGSAIRGKVLITPIRDVDFDKLQIDLLGTSTTRTSGILHDTLPTKFTFFQLSMPIPPESLPEDKRLAARQTIEIPFFFVVPQQRPLQACIHETHLELPPTIGNWEKTDQSPETAKIEYSIRVRATPARKDIETLKLVEVHRYLRLLPSNFQEDALCTTDPIQEIKLGRSYAKSDSLTIAGIPPTLVYLSCDSGKISNPMITAHLEFVTKAKPATVFPVIQVKSAAVQTTTTYAQIHLAPKSGENGRQAAQLPHVVLCTKSKKVIVQSSQSTWQKAETPTGSDTTKYLSTLTLALDMPNHEKTTFLPTFNACLISRSYALRVGLAAESGSGSTLELPFQVIVRDLTSPTLPKYTVTSRDQNVTTDALPEYRQSSTA